MTDGAGTETRAYDSANRLLFVARGQDTFSYLYDQAGNVTRRTYPGGTVADYACDDDGRLASVTSGGELTSYAYDPAGNPTQTTLPAGNGYVETRAYDRAGRLAEVENAKSGSVLSRFQATLDPVGDPVEIVRTGSLSETQTYTYDAGDRLTSVCFQASCPGSGDPFIRWTYDAVGNRLSEQRPQGTTSYTYDAADELTQAGSTTYDYDANGNQTSAGSATFAYDLDNRLKALSDGGTTTTYTYDGDGVRLRASTGSDQTNYLWDVNDDLPQLAIERDGQGGLLRRYLYALRRVSMTTGSGTSYYHYDRLGSVVNDTSSTGATEWTYAYEPYGATRVEEEVGSGQPENPMRFTGEYLDPTGLCHLRARQYDPDVGRFLQLDPATSDPSQALISRYVYAGDRPSIYVDPSGERFVPPDDAALQTIDATSPRATCQPGTSAESAVGSIPSPNLLSAAADIFQFTLHDCVSHFQDVRRLASSRATTRAGTTAAVGGRCTGRVRWALNDDDKRILAVSKIWCIGAIISLSARLCIQHMAFFRGLRSYIPTGPGQCGAWRGPALGTTAAARGVTPRAVRSCSAGSHAYRSKASLDVSWWVTERIARVSAFTRYFPRLRRFTC